MASFGGQQNQEGMSTGENSNSGLRKPKEDTISRLLSTHGAGGGSKTSNLSVNAPEFVPRARSGYKAPSLSASAPEFVPRMQPIDTYINQQLDYDPVLEEFKNTLYILNSQPGNVEEYIRPLCEKFKQGVTTAEQMTEIIDALFKKSVEEQNFRYTGARICQQICTVLRDHPVLSSFRNALLKRCQREYDRREDLVTNPDQLELLTGFTLFMGELFLNLEMEDKQSGKKIKMKILPDILKDLVLTLLSQPSKITVKCTCQLLKLVGYNMELMMRPTGGGPSSFDEVFQLLDLVMQSGTLDETSKFMIKSVLNLRQINWGQPESTSSSISDSDFNGSLPPGLLENEPVFYNASGQTISREEAGFYEEGDEAGYILNEEEQQYLDAFEAESNGNEGFHNDAYGNWSQTDDQGYYGLYSNEGEMDDEAEAAFDEFLKQTQGYH